MIAEPLREMIKRAATDSGAFPSVAHLPGGPVADENAFVTALACDLLGKLDAGPEIEAIRQRGLDFLLRCRRPGGGFAFYPADAQPAWIPDFLPADADDSALCALALFHAGRWHRPDLRHMTEVLDSHRVRTRPLGQTWFRADVYPTWLDTRRLRNPIDVCVNVNVLLLIETSGVGSGSAIVGMVGAALDWVGECPIRARSIMPWYPHPVEFRLALERAEAGGVQAAASLLRRVRAQAWGACDEPADAPVCCSPGGGVVWKSPLLQALRRSLQGQRLADPTSNSHFGG